MKHLLFLLTICFFIGTPQPMAIDNLDSSLVKLHNQMLYDRAQFNTFKLIHPLLLLTKESDLEPCSKYFDEQEEFNKSLSCANQEVFNKKPYNTTLKADRPQCFVVTKKSADVETSKDGVFNYISFSLLGLSGIVGFYDHGVTYIVENTDIAAVYRHEVSHHFLELIEGDGDADHSNLVWFTCQSQYYTPSDEAIKKAKE